jgi:hypothetical protein
MRCLNADDFGNSMAELVPVHCPADFNKGIAFDSPGQKRSLGVSGLQSQTSLWNGMD